MKCMMAQLLASKYSPTVELVTDISNCHTCMSVNVYDGNVNDGYSHLRSKFMRKYTRVSQLLAFI